MFGSAKYRNYRYGADDHVAVVHTEKLPSNTVKFICATVEASSHNGQFDYSKNFYAKDADELVIKLPTVDGKINYNFMESFIAELEAAHLAELEAYLVASGLSDYQLSREERAVIAEFNSLEWKDFLVKDIFQKISVKKVQKGNVRKIKSDEYVVPVVYCKFGDNGIMYWGEEGKVEVRENIISVIYNGAIAAGKVYAQKEPTGILAESYFISHLQRPGSHEINLFLSASLEKVLYPKYSRDYLATWGGRVENDSIILPIDSDGKIDYKKIFILISAIKKLVIKDVVDFSRRKSAATRQAIES